MIISVTTFRIMGLIGTLSITTVSLMGLIGALGITPPSTTRFSISVLRTKA